MPHDQMKEKIPNLTNSLFEVLSQLKGINFQTKTYLEKYSKQVEKAFDKTPVAHLTSNFILNDLKAKTLQESEQIFLENSYGGSNDQAKSQIKTNLKYHFALSLSHAYEVFEIFVKSTLRILEEYDQQEITSNIKTNKDLRRNAFEPTVDNLSASNNDTYFKILRRILPEVAKIEQKNARNINLTKWYKAFSNFRHSIVHGNLICSNEDYKKHQELTERYFPVQKHCNSPNCSKWKFNIDYDFLVENLTIVGEYAYLIATELGTKYRFEIKKA